MSNMNDPVAEFIGRVVHGKSFADVGGLWGTVNEKVSIAQAHGASELAMLDVTPQGHELWNRFLDRVRDLGVPEVRCLTANVVELDEDPTRPMFDVVHSTGVLYHLPDPVRGLFGLASITREHLIVGCAVIPPRISISAGELEVPPGGWLFLPRLPEASRAVLREHWIRDVGENVQGLMVDLERWNPKGFVPWWWLPTIESFKAMASAAGFEYIDGVSRWNGHSFVQLLRKL